MGLFSWLFGSNAEESEDEYYADLHEEFYGKRPDHKLTDDEKIELEELDEEEWEEDDL